jgi:hypothetical protein
MNTTDLNNAIGVLISAADVRSSQWAGVAEGERPDSLIDELWEADADEARFMADTTRDAIRVVRESME